MIRAEGEAIRVVHASHGKFHHHDLARELSGRGLLEAFYTGYPRWKLRDENLPYDRVHTFPWLETPYMALLKVGALKGALKRQLEWALYESFDKHVARKMPYCDAFIGLSCASLHAGRAIQRRGGVYICDRGSAHIRTQDSLLADEYLRHKIRYQPIDQRVQDKEAEEYELADAILVPSEFARRSFIEQGLPEQKLHKVPYGVDLRRFSKIGEPDTARFDVLFVGALSLQKGVPDLLRAFRDVDYPFKRLRLVGEITDEIKPFIAAQRNFGDVELLGHWPQERLREIMSRSHVMVLPSIQDGFGLVLAQALACGCPVVASTNTGAKDLFTDGVEGFIVPIRSAHEIADRLQRLADNPLLRDAMGAAALRRVHTIGGWNDYGDRIAAVLNQLCK